VDTLIDKRNHADSTFESIFNAAEVMMEEPALIFKFPDKVPAKCTGKIFLMLLIFYLGTTGTVIYIQLLDSS
jgi:hypothetical protein